MCVLGECQGGVGEPFAYSWCAYRRIVSRLGERIYIAKEFGQLDIGDEVSQLNKQSWLF